MAQPFFLCQLCVGAFILAFAVFPMSLPGASTIQTTTTTTSTTSTSESTLSMDIACMSSLWLILIGFSIAFSALASKIYRVGQVVACGTQYQRATVSVRHVMAPLYMSLAFNTIMLLCLTFLAPLHYERVPIDTNYDSFGRSTSSYGSCQPTSSTTNKLLVSLAVVNTLGVVYVAHLAYKEREFPDDFSDLKSLSLATLSLLETLLIGLPVLLAARNDPTVLYLAASGMVCVPFVVILLLVFLPKYQMRNRKFDFRTLGRALSQCGSNRSLGSKSSFYSDYNHNKSTSAAGTNSIIERHSSIVSIVSRQSGKWDAAPQSQSDRSWGQTNVRRINRNSITVR